MLASIKDWFEKSFIPTDTQGSNDAVLRRACAVLLCEIMHADHTIDSTERDQVLEAMQNFLGMSVQEAQSLYQEIQAMMKDALSLQEFTSLLNDAYSEEKKLTLLAWLWRVVFADGSMDAHEEHLMRRIADLLYIRHSDYIRIRNQVQAATQG
jgi:uncharacterized tellurite resistance protein B-like protein